MTTMNLLSSIPLLLLLLLPSSASSAAVPGIPEYCLDFTLEVSAIGYEWMDCQGGTDCDIDPVNEVFWGVPGTSDGRSGLTVDSDDIDFDITLQPNNQFRIGEMTHLNYQIQAGGGIDQISLCIEIFTNVGNFKFVYDMTIDETTNNKTAGTDACPYFSEYPCSDRVFIINDPSPHEIAHTDDPDIKFEIDLFGFRTDPNSETVNEFISQELGQTSAGLYAGLHLIGCPRRGGGVGDPHFQTWSGHWYDFHGGCDMHLVNAPHFAGDDQPMTIDIRTHVRDWYSFIERAAIQIGDDILEASGFGEYYLNGVSGYGEDFLQSVTTFADFPMNYSNPEKHLHVLEITVGVNETIFVRSFKDMVSVKIEGAHKKRFRDSNGLMGDFQTGQVYARNSNSKTKTILEDPVAVAREWQVRDDEPMLFHATREPQYPQACVMPKNQQQKATGRRLGKTVALKAAQKACAHWSADTREMCVQDVMRTGDLEMATTGAFL